MKNIAELKEMAKRFLEKVSEAVKDEKKIAELEAAAEKLLDAISKAIPIIKFRAGGLKKMAKLLAKKALAEARDLEKTAKPLANKAIEEARDEKNQQEALGMAGAVAAPVGVLAVVTSMAASTHGIAGAAAMTAGLGLVGLSVTGVALPAAGLTVAGYFGGKYAARRLQKAWKRGHNPEAPENGHGKEWLVAAGSGGMALIEFLLRVRQVLQQKVRTGRRISKRDKKILYERQNGRCNGCKGKYDIKDLEIDHIVPKSRGGSDDLENLQLLCGHCNRTKGPGTMKQLYEKLRKKGIGE